MKFKTKRAEYLITNHVGKKHFGKAEFAGLPLYKSSDGAKLSVWKYLLPTILLITLLGAGFFLNNKN